MKNDIIEWIYSLQIFDKNVSDGGFMGNVQQLGIPYHKSDPQLVDSIEDKNIKNHEKGHIVRIKNL